MSRICYFLACGHFHQSESDGFKWRLFMLFAEFGSLDYELCTDYLFQETSTEGDSPWGRVRPEDAVVILADTDDPTHRARMDVLTEYARERGVEPRYCLAP